MSECPTKSTRKFFSIFSFLASAASASFGSAPIATLPASNVKPSRTIENSAIIVDGLLAGRYSVICKYKDKGDLLSRKVTYVGLSAAACLAVMK